MRKVLIAAVGEEPTPNLVPLFADNVGPFDLVQFMLSDKPEVRRVAENLENAIRKDPGLAHLRVDEHRDLNAWELATARNQVAKAIEHHRTQNRNVTVNVTGGTKIMSVASLEAAREAVAPALYVNTEREEIIHYDPECEERAARFKVRIPIATQFRAAGREIKQTPKPLQPSDVDRHRVDFARYLLANYEVAHRNVIRNVLACCAGRLRAAVPVPGERRSKDVAKRAHDAGLWDWDEEGEVVKIASQDAYAFLNGGWVEVYALNALSDNPNFDEVLGNVELSGFDGELDVVVSRNGRMGIVECKTTGPSPGRSGERSEGMSFVVAKARLHEVILGGPYAASMFAFASDANFRRWEKICEQYGIPEPLFGQKVKGLAAEMYKRMAPRQ